MRWARNNFPSKAHTLNINLSKLVNNLWNLNINLPTDGSTMFDDSRALHGDVNSFWFFPPLFSFLWSQSTRVSESDYCRKLCLGNRGGRQKKIKAFMEKGRARILADLFAFVWFRVWFCHLLRGQKLAQQWLVLIATNGGAGVENSQIQFEIRVVENYNCRIRKIIKPSKLSLLFTRMAFWCCRWW